MKKVIVFCFILTLLGSIDFQLSSCSRANAANSVDVVNDTEPVDPHDIGWRTEFIAKLKPLTPEQRTIAIDRALPRLNSSLMAALRGKFKCTDVLITYMFGSGTADSVASGDGKKYSGYFKDQLYAVVKSPNCITDSVTLFVQCFNGWVTLKADKDVQTIGTYKPVFTIEKLRGLNYYVDYLTSVWIAEKFHCTLHKGRGWEGKVITPAEARGYENDLDRQAVTVEVFPGDIIDLGNMTYNGKSAQ